MVESELGRGYDRSRDILIDEEEGQNGPGKIEDIAIGN